MRLGGLGDEQAQSLDTARPTGLESHARTVTFHGVLEVGSRENKLMKCFDEVGVGLFEQHKYILTNLELAFFQVGWNYLSVPGRAFFADSMRS